MSEWNKGIIDEFRANDGAVGGMFEGRPLLLLHHEGAKSGVARVSPLMYKKLHGAYAVFASKGGSDANPGWYHNLVAKPHVSVEVGNEKIDVVARVAEDDERERIWEPWKEEYPQFADYEEKTARDHIPVIVLEPV